MVHIESHVESWRRQGNWPSPTFTRWSVGIVALLPVALLLPFAVFLTVNSQYSFTWLHVAMIGLALIVITVATTQAGKAALVVSTVATLAVAATGVYTLTLWPGGDDGPGMAWLFMVVVPSVVVGVASPIGLWSIYGIAVFMARRHNRRRVPRAAV